MSKTLQLLPCHIYANNKYVPEMSNICHIWKLVHMKIRGNYFSIYTSYELTASNNVTRNIGTYIFCTLHIDPKLLHISVIQPTECNFNLPCYGHICTSNKYAKCPNYSMVPQWGREANTYTTYEFTGINCMIISAVHRKQWWQCRLID